MSDLIRNAMRFFSNKFTARVSNAKISSRRCGFRDLEENGWFQRKTGELITGFPIRAEDTLVDVGCGHGGASMFAAGQGAEVIAVDIRPDVIERMDRELAKSKARSHRAVLSDANPLPLEDNSASCMLAMEVLEHVDDPDQFLTELVRVGKPDARYLITVPDPVAENVQKRVAKPGYWEKPNHVRIFEREELAQTVTRSGLTIESRGHRSFFWAMWWILFWGSEQKKFDEPEAPVLANWTATWHELMQCPKGKEVRAALDEFMPKGQYVIARKAA